jgi:hypothetical protein
MFTGQINIEMASPASAVGTCVFDENQTIYLDCMAHSLLESGAGGRG